MTCLVIGLLIGAGIGMAIMAIFQIVKGDDKDE